MCSSVQTNKTADYDRNVCGQRCREEGGGGGGHIYISIDRTLCCHLIDQIVVNKHEFLNSFYPFLKAAMIKCGSINHGTEYFISVRNRPVPFKKGWVRQNSIFAIRFSPRPHQSGPLLGSG